MSKGLINTILIIVGLAVLYFIAQGLFAEHKIPSFGDIVASSTLSVASSSEAQENSSAQMNSTTTPRTSPFQKLFESIASSTSAAKKSYSDITFLPSTSIITSKGSVKAFVANTEASREQGLSGQDSLPNGVGMLFVFNSSGKYGFWMKDMSFSLDLIWIDANKKIVGVTKNVLPSSYPFVFMPPKDILYVLEMNAGSVTEFGLTTGTSLKFSVSK
ncbi:MAG: DUF192 domain-containing protein [Patescibacteria group bacterium]